MLDRHFINNAIIKYQCKANSENKIAYGELFISLAEWHSEVAGHLHVCNKYI